MFYFLRFLSGRFFETDLTTPAVSFYHAVVWQPRDFGDTLAPRHHMSVVISVNFRVDSLLFDRFLGSPGGERSCNIGQSRRKIKFWLSSVLKF